MNEYLIEILEDWLKKQKETVKTRLKNINRVDDYWRERFIFFDKAIRATEQIIECLKENDDVCD